ncbi:thioredoxin domain-containing protein [Cryobacterium sp. PH31-AA6]|uniref:DsbA family protein n=1 Tax=Cryobacterium sp. PH31-AA6 TaxID=3046205 RepID=UPI0024BA2767|nr:thioredoxin domain-containing protein [Cryobacterium sp. PH31-AA6]MDJ0324271.1 thioredoxin domain-containing protein [Cryobacterium sp. PH31-AA6]
MTIGGSGEGRPSKNQRRDAARIKATRLRVQQKKKDRRNRVFLQGGIAVASIAVVAIIALIIMNSIRPAGPGPANMASDGILIGEGMTAVTTSALQPNRKPVPSKPDSTGTVADIRIYVDYLCPFCGQFEKANSSQIVTWVKSGAATVEIHPISILTSKSAGTQYSLRAANAAACVANYAPDDFYAFNTALFADQPKEGTAGLDDSEIKSLVKTAGVGTASAKINTCIDDATFKAWVVGATDRALSGPLPNSSVKAITGTPTVLVNGKQYVGALDDPKEFAAFVLQSAGETYSTSTPAPAG